MATLGEYLGGAIYGVKNALGLGQTNLFPGDVSQATLGQPASSTYGGDWQEQINAQTYANPVGVARYNNPLQNQAPAPVQAPAPATSNLPYPNPSNGWQEEQNRNFLQQQQASSPQDSYAQQARNDISSGYDQYFNQLDQMLNQGLPSQRTAQEGIAQSQYTQGINQLTPQRQEGLDLLGKQRTQTQEGQVRSLRDISGNIRNAMMAGNVFLGSQGAGDSSASNQYAYALNKLGTQQRGDTLRQGSDIMREIGDREAKLQNIFTQETNRLGSERDQKIMQVASWFADAQRQLQLAKGQGQLGRGQDLANISKTLLNNALGELNRINTEASNSRSMLEQWALNNAKTVQEARSNLQQVGQYNPASFSRQQQAGTPQVDARGNLATYFPGSGQEEKRDIFGTRIA